MSRRSFNIIVFRKVFHNNTDESKGFETVFCLTWHGVTNFKNVFSRLDRDYNDWWYINVYERPGGKYVGRIYSNTKSFKDL